MDPFHSKDRTILLPVTRVSWDPVDIQAKNRGSISLETPYPVAGVGWKDPMER